MDKALLVLGTENPAKSIKMAKDIKKDQQLAALAFFDYMPLSEAKEYYKGTKVDKMTELIIEKFSD